MLRFSTIFGAVGVAVGLILSVVAFTSNYLDVPRFGSPLHGAMDHIFLMLWPASLGYMALDNAGFVSTVVGISEMIICNAILYFVLGVIFWLGFNRHKLFLLLPTVIIAGIFYWAFAIYL